MEKHYCPICGNELGREYANGVICLCCGNESGYDDDIEKDDIDYDEYLVMLKIRDDFERKRKPVPDHVRSYLDNARYDKRTAWEMLRKKWIEEEGCRWKYGDGPGGWSREMAQEQLKRIEERCPPLDCQR